MDKTPLYSSSLDPADCPLTATLYVYNDLNNIWENKSASTSEPWVGFKTTDDASSNKAG